MAKQRHLKNAPITEALIDFKVKLPSDFRIQGFESLILDRYPKRIEQRKYQTKLHIKKDEQLTQDTEYDIGGYFFKSEDEKNIVQFRKDGFSFSRLNPYTKWNDIFEEVRNLWDIYTSKASPELITRIATRYINRFDLALPIDVDDYLTSPPKIPENINGNIGGFLSRVVVNNPGLKYTSIIIQALEMSAIPDNVTVIFDIDVFKQHDFELDDDSLWPIFEQFRDEKNRIFFESITEKTAGLFE
ncbi:MAG: TIGR04255 family protein [Deltaproteobacteria bacterium]|nr:TIGR04255 family protein [Deltaproteobacteria bacterium]